MSNPDDRPTTRPPASVAQTDASDLNFLSEPRIPVAARVPTFGRPDPNSWSDVQLNTIVKGMKELKRARETFDPEKLLDACVGRIEKVVQANMDLILGQLATERARTTAHELEMSGLRDEVARLNARIVTLETRLDNH